MSVQTASQLANLRPAPAWQPGQTGGGHLVPAGVRIGTWYSVMARWEPERIRRLASQRKSSDDGKLTAAKLAAAKRWFRTWAGNDRAAESALEGIHDRTVGRPAQHVVTVTATMVDAVALLAQCRQLFGVVAEPALPAPDVPRGTEPAQLVQVAQIPVPTVRQATCPTAATPAALGVYQ